MFDLALDWLDELPDMRISGVPGVPGVQPQKTAPSAGTHPDVARCDGVPDHTSEHHVTPPCVPLKPAENRHCTPGTPITPQNDIEAIEAGLIQLRRRRPPRVTNPVMWWGALIDAVRLHTDGWTEKALSLGWSMTDLYGIGPVHDGQFSGLAPWLNGREVVMIDERGASAAFMSRGAAIEQPVRYRRRAASGCRPVMIWDFGR